MIEKLRIEKLNEILKNEEPYSTGIPINYKGETMKFNAYKIPLEYLIYNKYNGRIGTVVKSFEKQNYELNAELEDHKKVIEKFLWDSKKDRNKRTEESLAKDRQQKFGIVSRNGVIIDGNRRASILNRIYRNRQKWQATDVTHCKYFIALILPDDAGKKEIIELETRYQMGQDEKLDYNAEEKYLKCSELKLAGFNEKEIADMMGEKEAKIKEMLSIFELMNDYLGQYEYDGIFTRLEKREGQFVDLNNYLNNWKERKSKSDWAYDDFDIAELKAISFDYIRAQYEGKEFRIIGKTNRNNTESFFANKNIWEDFKERHLNLLESVSEKTVDDLRQENPNEDLGKILEARDKDWTSTIEDGIKFNLRHTTSKLDDKQESNQPLILLRKAKSTLESLNIDVPNFWLDTDVESILSEINKITYEYKKIIKEKRKAN